MTTSYSVRYDHVWVRYGEHIALEDITFDVPHGDFLVIMGPNGAGKSTLLKTTLALVPLWKGKVEVLGVNPYKDRRVLKRVGYVPQRERVNENVPLRAIDVVLMGLMTNTKLLFKKEEYVEKAIQALKEMGLEDVAYKLYSELSGGQKQRVLIARAIVANPDILLLDEPFSALDVQSSRLVARSLKRLNDKGKTIILVTHDFAPVANYAKRVALLNRKLIAIGKPTEVFTAENIEKTYGVKAPVAFAGNICIPILGDQHER